MRGRHRRGDEFGAQPNVREENGRWVVSKGLDASKDQSYVLWGLEQKNLARTRFPIRGFTKAPIREMAMESGFPELAQKSESYEICFIPDNDYRGFLKRKHPERTAALQRGRLVGTDVATLGEHDGYPFFTIGQRKGLGIAVGEPLYVTEIIPESNTVVLGGKEDLKRQTMWVRQPNLQKWPALNNTGFTLEKLESIIADRKTNPSASSYTSSLFAQGINKVAQKVGEEAVELIIESKVDNKELFLGEAADLLYHYLVLLQMKSHTLKEVIEVLSERHK